jgi:hypothetical protein
MFLRFRLIGLVAIASPAGCCGRSIAWQRRSRPGIAPAVFS